MIHCQILREDQLDAMQELSIFPSMFPAHTYYWGDYHPDSVLGPERANRISPTKSALNRGMKRDIASFPASGWECLLRGSACLKSVTSRFKGISRWNHRARDFKRVLA
ncbi:amidohydrolase [Kalymmatonema gypsitolerans NIES-4073]|nr:amidohydrolase [Scytonema sp. NIES-4073]